MSERFDVMEVFDDMTHFLRPDARHVFYIMTSLFVVMTYFRHYFWNKI